MSYGMNGWNKPDGDLVSRAAAIGAVNTALFPKINTAKDAEKALRALPSAQPEKRTDKHTETHACDCISRKAAIDAVCEMVKECFGADEEEQTAIAVTIRNLPSAQPERKTGKWLREIGAYLGGYPRYRYHCSVCGNVEEHVYADSKCANFCPNCGARMKGEIE